MCCFFSQWNDLAIQSFPLGFGSCIGEVFFHRREFFLFLSTAFLVANGLPPLSFLVRDREKLDFVVSVPPRWGVWLSPGKKENSFPRKTFFFFFGR